MVQTKERVTIQYHLAFKYFPISGEADNMEKWVDEYENR